MLKAYWKIATLIVEVGWEAGKSWADSAWHAPGLLLDTTYSLIEHTPIAKVWPFRVQPYKTVITAMPSKWWRPDDD